MLRTLLDFLDTIAVVEINPSHAVHHLFTHIIGIAPSSLTRIY